MGRLILKRSDMQKFAREFGAVKFPEFTNQDTLGLWGLNSWMTGHDSDNIHRRLRKRWKLMDRIDKCRITGTDMMWVTESGMDCDCVQYSGTMHKCEATIQGLEKLYYETNEWADGPFSLYPVTEKEREEIRPQSRDLMMEAFEDGHPHSISTATDITTSLPQFRRTR